MSSVAALPFSAWPTGRRVAVGAFAVIGYAALACAAVYLAGVLFLVLNKANPKQAQFASIVHYWGLYADDAQLRKKLQLAIGVSGIGLMILLPAGLVAAARPRPTAGAVGDRRRRSHRSPPGQSRPGDSCPGR